MDHYNTQYKVVSFTMLGKVAWIIWHLSENLIIDEGESVNWKKRVDIEKMQFIPIW